MPLSDHVVNQYMGSDSGHMYEGVVSSEKREKPVRRQGIPIDPDDASESILSPILSHLPSLSGISSFKGFLPTSPQWSSKSLKSVEVSATWQEADVDGSGNQPLLLISSKSYALQIFKLASGRMPDDPHVTESFPAPEEVFCIPSIRYADHGERSTLMNDDNAQMEGKEDQVLCAKLLDSGPLYSLHGLVVAVITIVPHRKASQSALSLAIINLSSGVAIKRVRLGNGSAASLAVSSRAFAVSISHPSPSIHILDQSSLKLIYPVIDSLPADPITSLPIFSLSGRLLAYVTSTPPSHPGPEGFGSMVTAKTTVRARSHTMTPADPPDAQGVLLSSAVEIGGGVARGVWAGLKMGARAANNARIGRLARSAPAESSGTLADDEDRDDSGESEARSLDQSSVEDDLPTSPEDRGEEWVKVIDLFPRASGSTSRAKDASGSASQSVTRDSDVTTVAHFRPPLSQAFAPSNRNEHRIRRPVSQSPSQPISFLSFNSLGTQLLVAPDGGRVQHIFEIHPAGASGEVRGEVKGEVWHLYELRRGNTAGTVCQVAWSQDGRSVAVGTGKGTIHVFPINPTGGPPSAHAQLSVRNVNPQQLYPLSTVVTAIGRLRPQRIDAAHNTVSQDGPGSFIFTDFRLDPLVRGALCRDLAIFRPARAQVELARLTLRAGVPRQATHTDHRRGSALTEMMRSKAFGQGLDIDVERAVKTRWMIPLGDSGEVFLEKGKTNPLTETSGSSLARAEIQTFCSNPRILPGSIYLSHQMDFFAAQPIDEYSPLSIIDIEARTRRLIFRPEVEARPISPEIKSFDEPLSSALHSVIESPPNTQIPRLPNGYPGNNRWRSIPIRHVAAGLGEGVDRVRREYVRAQHTRAKRRASEAANIAANGLSFEDDAVFPTAMEGQDEEEEGSTPSSAVLPATNTDESGQEQDDDWGDKWEEEYRKAVEEDGGPEELVLGLMDEEEEERREWLSQNKSKKL